VATSSRASAARTHKMMLDHYQQTKNLLVSYDPKAMGFF
jgi:aldehyde dehydrogenase